MFYFPKCRTDSIPIGRKYAHQHSSAIVLPLPFLPSAILVKAPVIGMMKQLMKKIPCSIIRHFSHLSALLSAFIESPMKKVESAIMP